jgi:hypothetical protein
MRKSIIAAAAAIGLLSACKTTSSAMDGVKSAGQSVASGVSGAVPSLVNVDLKNVLNNLALDLHIDKANIPINAQIPINIAANVCGVSINVLSIGAGGGSSQGCTAQTASPELVQAVQQQLAANGSVGGGAQSGTTTAPATSIGTCAVTGILSRLTLRSTDRLLSTF